MNPKAFAVLAAITVVVTIAAGFGAAGRYRAGPPAGDEKLLFPALPDEVNRLAEMTVLHGDGRITLRRRQSGWVVVEKDAHPARADKVRKAAIQLSQLRLVEAKTTMVKRFPRLEVEDVEGANAQSKLLRLADSEGKTLAEVIVGKRRLNLGGVGGEGIYVRKPGDAQAWLARGELDVAKKVLDWLVRDIVDIAAKRVERVTTTSADGASLTVSRDPEGKGRFRIEGLAEGAKLKTDAQSTIDRMGSALAVLDFTDVAAAAGMDFPDDARAEAEVRTVEGLVVRVTMIDNGDETWARLEASAEPPEGGDAGKVAEEAAKINARVTGWAYRLPAHKARPLKTSLADLVEAKPEPKP